MDHAGINQPRLFAPGDDFDGETQCRFGFGKEICDVFGNAERVGCHGAYLFGAEAAQAFAEFCQTVQSLFLGSGTQVFLFVQTGGEAHHLFERIDNFQLSVVVFANLEAETVGTQIDGGEDVCGMGGHGGYRWGKNAMLL